jgi:hypothetical protein
LFTDGKSAIEIKLADEPESLRRAVGRGFVTDSDLSVSQSVRTHVFEPYATVPSPVFWGYLVHAVSNTDLKQAALANTMALGGGYVNLNGLAKYP